MFVFCNPCARAELHQQKRARKLCSATLNAQGTVKKGSLVGQLTTSCRKYEKQREYFWNNF